MTTTTHSQALPHQAAKQHRYAPGDIRPAVHALLAVIILIWSAGLLIGFTASLMLLSVLGFALTIFGLRHATMGFFGIGILCTLDAVMGPLVLTGGFLRQWNSFNYWLLLVMLVYAPFLLRLHQVQIRLLQLFILLLGLEIAIAPNRLLGVQHVLALVTMFGLVVYMARIGQNSQVWLWQAIVCGTLAAVGGLVYYLQQDRLPYINPNAWVYFPLTALFAICLAFSMLISGRARLTLSLLALINLAWIFFSGSRGGLSITLICLIYLVVATPRRVHAIFFVITGLLVILGLSIPFANLETQALERLDILVDPSHSLSSRTSGRSDLALGGWYIFLDHPLGVGTGGFAAAWAELGPREGLSSFKRNVAFPAHSAWIKVIAENGIAGAVLFASYLCSFAVIGWRNGERTLRPLGLLVTAALCVGFLSTEFQGKGLWFLAAGGMVLLHHATMTAHLRDAARRKPITNIIRPAGIHHD